MPPLRAPLVEHQARVRAAKAERIRHHALDRADVLLLEDLEAFPLLDEVVDVGGLGQEAAVGHEHGVDGLVHARGAQRVAGEGLCRAHKGVVTLLAEDALHGRELLHVPHGRGRAVRVDVLHGPLAADAVGHLQGQLHAALAAHARGCHHVVAVSVGRVSHELGVDAGAAGLGVLELLKHKHATTTSNDEAVAVLVEGARGFRGIVIALGGERAHAVEHGGELPALVLAGADHGHVSLVQLDLLHADADAVGACRACRGDREGWPLQLEGRGQHCGDRGAHGPRHAVRTHLGRPSLRLRLDGAHGLGDIADGGAALAQDAGAARVALVLPGLKS
mmetsp:Transcript_97784/g.237813  ORF Transcript_97784/g.237813 Transcript_97784/m.237813 type:complete len:334 (-) Transcript_97784:683-1684(-)